MNTGTYTSKENLILVRPIVHILCSPSTLKKAPLFYLAFSPDILSLSIRLLPFYHRLSSSDFPPSKTLLLPRIPPIHPCSHSAQPFSLGCCICMAGCPHDVASVNSWPKSISIGASLQSHGLELMWPVINQAK